MHEIRCPHCRKVGLLQGDALSVVSDALGDIRQDGRAWGEPAASRDGASGGRMVRKMPTRSVLCGVCSKSIELGITVSALPLSEYPLSRARLSTDSAAFSAPWHGAVMKIFAVSILSPRPLGGADESEQWVFFDDAVGHAPAQHVHVRYVGRFSSVVRWANARGYTSERVRIGNGGGSLNRAVLDGVGKLALWGTLRESPLWKSVKEIQQVYMLKQLAEDLAIDIAESAPPKAVKVMANTATVLRIVEPMPH